MGEDLQQQIQDELDGCDTGTRLEMLTILRIRELFVRLDELESQESMTDGKSLYKEHYELFSTDAVDEEGNFPTWINQTELIDLYKIKSLQSKWGD